jgi:protein TonB
MNDPVDRLIMERAALDRGFSRGVVISAAAHLMLVGIAIAGPMLMPKKPLIQVAPVFAVPIPRGVLDPGSGPKPKADPAKPDPPKPEPTKKKELIKPPTEEKKTGLPLKDLKKPAKTTPTAAPAGGNAGSTNPLGVDIGPPGLPEGDALSGDFYMGSVVAKIARIWRSRIQQGLTTAVVVRFTILADGSVIDVQIIESSGAYLLDSAAKSAVATAAPFQKLPAHYDTQYCNPTRCTVQVRFTR